MKEKIMENGIEYVRCGNYYIPNLTVPECKHEIGKYGNLRRKHLKSHKHCQYSALLMTGKLFEHLHEVDVQAQKILEQFIEQAEKNAPDKATQQMAWVGHMNNAKACAEEIILSEIIYI